MTVALTITVSPTDVRLEPLGTQVPFTAQLTATASENISGASVVVSGISVNGAPTIVVSGITNASGAFSGDFSGFAQAVDALGDWNVQGQATPSGGVTWSGNETSSFPSGVATDVVLDAFDLDPPSTRFTTVETGASHIAFSAIYADTVTNSEGLDNVGGGAVDKLGLKALNANTAVRALNFSKRMNDVEVEVTSGAVQGVQSLAIGGTTGNPSAVVVDFVQVVIPQIGGSAVWTPSAQDFLTIVDANGNVVLNEPLTMPQLRVPFTLFPSGSSEVSVGPYNVFVALGDQVLPSGSTYVPTQPGFLPPFDLNLGFDFGGIALQAANQLGASGIVMAPATSGLIPSGASSATTDLLKAFQS